MLITLRSISTNLKYVLNVNTVNVVDEFRLLRAIFSRIIIFRNPRKLEEYLGKSIIVRHRYGPYFLVRANTSDLYHVALEEDYELRTWFLPLAKGIVVDVGASGRNFQSIPTSEDKAGAFLLTYSPNIEGLYLKRPVTNIFIPLLTNTTFMHGALYSLYSHDYIQVLYYYVGDVNMLNAYLSYVLRSHSIIYMSPTTTIIKHTG